MATAQQGPTPEFALAYRDIMLMGLTNELKATKKVLAAIPDAKRDYKPDPNSRTAGDLAWHLASADVQMLDETADRKFAMEARFKDEPKTIGGTGLLVREKLFACYRAGTSNVAGRVAYPGRLLRRFHSARRLLSRLCKQSQHPSPRSACHLPASHGIQMPIHLRRQLR